MTLNLENVFKSSGLTLVLGAFYNAYKEHVKTKGFYLLPFKRPRERVTWAVGWSQRLIKDVKAWSSTGTKMFRGFLKASSYTLITRSIVVPWRWSVKPIHASLSPILTKQSSCFIACAFYLINILWVCLKNISHSCGDCFHKNRMIPNWLDLWKGTSIGKSINVACFRFVDKLAWGGYSINSWFSKWRQPVVKIRVNICRRCMTWNDTLLL